MGVMGAVKRWMVAAALAALGSQTLAADYATCLLNKLPCVSRRARSAPALLSNPARR